MNNHNMLDQMKDEYAAPKAEAIQVAAMEPLKGVESSRGAVGTLKQALQYAVAGYRIAPLKEDTKFPPIKDWKTKATTDPDRSTVIYCSSKCG